jgi:hypothetical protein
LDYNLFHNLFLKMYFTIWGRNMDTKNTTGEQITGN